MKTRLPLLLVLILILAGCTVAPDTMPVAPTAATTVTLPPTETPAPTAVPTETTAAGGLSVPVFDGARALQDVQTQVNFGPRTPGSEAHSQAVAWMQEQLTASGWAVELQETTYNSQPVRNVIARRGTEKTPWIILGAHYDSRMLASNDPDPANQNTPVPGANDGASGVAVLLEIARVLPADLDKQVWLVFFDSEDQGHIPGWDWIYGSRAFVDALQGTPDAAVIVDMIGDADLNIYMEQNSNPGLTREIWATAAERGHGEQFLPEVKYSILDDHTPFLEKGIRAIDIIDFDYEFWHTLQDTADKVSADSLFAVGDTLLAWLARPVE